VETDLPVVGKVCVSAENVGVGAGDRHVSENGGEKILDVKVGGVKGN